MCSSDDHHDSTTPLANILISRPYMGSGVLDSLVRWRDSVRLVVDCGAFTAAKSGRTVSLNEYCEFIEALPVAPWRYFALDVMGDPVGTLANYETMLARGLKPMAIFQRGESVELLEHYYRTSDVIGVGGMVNTPRWHAFVNGLTRAAAGRRLHWLGFTNLGFIKHHKPYMCDSSGFVTADRYGRLIVYMGHGRVLNLDYPSWLKCRDEAVFARIRHYGFEPRLLDRHAEWYSSASLNRMINIAGAVALSLDVQKHTGTLLFNAVTTANYIDCVCTAYARQAPYLKGSTR